MAHAQHEQLARPFLDVAGVDLDRAERVTYVLHQRFRYDYDAPVRDLQHRLVVLPRARHGSLRRRAHQVTVSVPDAHVATTRDRHGNLVVRVNVAMVAESVEFATAAAVERAGTAEVLVPAAARSDPRLLGPTQLTAADDRVRQLAAELRAETDDDEEFAERCCARIHAAIQYEYGVTSTSTTAAAALAGGRGVCQDHAHAMLAVCRAAGVPARYVSGHLLGEGGSHAWVEVIVAPPDGRGGPARALAFDPCNGCRARVRHLPVATGRDYRDVAPTSGTYAGEARGRLTASKSLGVVAAA